jgi:hypothetical protein
MGSSWVLIWGPPHTAALLSHWHTPQSRPSLALSLNHCSLPLAHCHSHCHFHPHSPSLAHCPRHTRTLWSRKRISKAGLLEKALLLEAADLESLKPEELVRAAAAIAKLGNRSINEWWNKIGDRVFARIIIIIIAILLFSWRASAIGTIIMWVRAKKLL